MGIRNSKAKKSQTKKKNKPTKDCQTKIEKEGGGKSRGADKRGAVAKNSKLSFWKGGVKRTKESQSQLHSVDVSKHGGGVYPKSGGRKSMVGD